MKDYIILTPAIPADLPGHVPTWGQHVIYHRMTAEEAARFLTPEMTVLASVDYTGQGEAAALEKAITSDPALLAQYRAAYAPAPATGEDGQPIHPPFFACVWA